MQDTKERFENPGRPDVPADYFVVVTETWNWYISREMAQAVEAMLDETPSPRWVMFVDLTGARVRIRARLVQCVFQCTAEQRELDRAFWRARKAERKTDKDWEEDE
jgi:hypothetical protein